MRYSQIIEASMPFGKLGNTTGMTFGFESEVIGKYDAFVDDDFTFDDEDDLIRELGIERKEFDQGYQSWLDDGNEGDWEDWINDVGLVEWWNKMNIDSYEYGIVGNRIVRYYGWYNTIEQVADHMKKDLGIDNIVYPYDSETPISDKDYSDWHIEGDASVYGDNTDDHAFEVISPIYYEYDDFISGLSKYLEWITEYWNGSIYTNHSTGFHVNIGMPDAKDKIDPLKLLLFSGEKWVTKLWRENRNGYTNELLPSLNKDGLPRSIKDASEFTKQFIHGLNEKSFAINLLTLMERGYVEFRPIGNRGYEHRFNDIVAHISRFIQLIQIASNPDMYRQEYAKKLGALIGGGQADTTTKSLPFEKRLVRNWVDGLNLRQSDKDAIMNKNGDIVITASLLVRICGLLENIPPQIINILIKYSGITKDQYVEAIQYIANRGWIMDEATIGAARSILDSYFGVSGDLTQLRY